jgi:GH25 family lysozyme M1 (1,4-beta-N-acetylmuramidase)
LKHKEAIAQRQAEHQKQLIEKQANERKKLIDYKHQKELETEAKILQQRVSEMIMSFESKLQSIQVNIDYFACLMFVD